MNRWRLSQIAAWTDGRVHGPDVEVTGVTTDTRKPDPGALFVALAGPRFDGHDFIRGPGDPAVAAVMVQHEVAGDHPRVEVDDTLQGLTRFAAGWRACVGACVVALTGSNGKTTVKEMLASILSRAGDTLATRGNLNNHIGVPLTLLEVTSAHRYAVVEMGANHPGEIAALTALAQPRVALVNNAGPAHLEGFGDLAGVAEAKGEIYGGLGADGVAVINAEDRFADYWLDLNRGREILRFALDADAEVRGTRLTDGRLRLSTPLGETLVDLQLPGRHNAMNALAAAAAAIAAEAELDAVREGLEAVSSVAGRLRRVTGSGGLEVLDDSYNANPASLSAGLAVLAESAAPRWLVLGDMAELGRAGSELHREAGEQARRLGVERLFAFGPQSMETADAFGAGAGHFLDMGELLDALRSALSQCSRAPCVLIKGSRSMGMERVVTALIDAGARQGDDDAV
jgi:UDP-N-acetylmuramoyl-tripeptide--D-alanyl-D-alanine ligase